MEITATELKERLDKGDEIVLLDIRQEFELGIACLDNTLHIPGEEVAARLGELESFREKDIVVYCRTGTRSQRTTEFLLSRGFEKVFNLTGGIYAWSDDVDPTVMKY